MSQEVTHQEQNVERAILVGLDRGNASDWTVEESLAELAELARTAGAEVLACVTQRRQSPDRATLIGPGKVQEVAQLILAYDANLVIFDDELSPVQHRNLEEALGVKVIDRTELILDIFAQRARSKEGKLQVELAQLQYLLPRLVGKGREMSRLGGGIGTRGPGETKLETDRRRIRQRISALRKELQEVIAHRELLRQQRVRNRVPVVALVGYTNAGKSTLFNALVGAEEVYTANQLFATLDPTMRAVELDEARTIILSDTVGFIRKLPHQLVAAFRATLEEAVEADLLLHVIDVSEPNFTEQMEAVHEVLHELGVIGKPMLKVFNKADLLEPGQAEKVAARFPQAIAVSAKYGSLERLKAMIAAALPVQYERHWFHVPYDNGWLVGALHEKGNVLAVEYTATGTRLLVELERVWAKRWAQFREEECMETR